MSNSIQYDVVFSVQQSNQKGEIEDWSFATKLKYNPSIQRVEWSSGERGRVVDYSKLDDVKICFPSEKAVSEKGIAPLAPSRITISDSFNRLQYILEPLTLDMYRQFIKPRISGHPDFSNEEEMFKFFRGL